VLLQSLYDTYPRLPKSSIGSLLPSFCSNERLTQHVQRLQLQDMNIPVAQGSQKPEADALETFVGGLLEHEGYDVARDFVRFRCLLRLLLVSNRLEVGRLFHCLPWLPS
jgi:dsRNA-specific ribonuclease